jgi:putative FmdB family regulatory protein
MPTYEFQCEDCKHEWEVYQSMSTPNPNECPSCKVEGKTKKLISLGSRGVVELYGQDLVDKLKGDAQQLKRDAAKNEQVYANLLGEEKYQSLQTKMDQQKTIRRSK